MSVIPSPNIWSAPQVYETENQGVDRYQVVESAIRSLLDWHGRTVLDVGCGTGFHLPRFAATASAVVGVEPHPPLAAHARTRVAPYPQAGVVQGSAHALPLADATIDLAHARWAYFFGPGCEPGLDELARVVRPGGIAAVVDIDATRSTFGRWFRQAWPDYDPAAVERFWWRQGWARERLGIRWDFTSRQDFDAVVRIEFAPAAADRILAEDTARTGVDYAVNLRWRRY